MNSLKKFKMIDEKFVCLSCGREVEPLNYSARDHCPYCLKSLHVDNNPGDRQNLCHGLLIPISLDKYKDTYKIVYMCNKCGQIKRNIIARDDDFDKIIEISNSIKKDN